MRVWKEFGRFTIDLQEDWTDLFHRQDFNWVELNLLQLYGELDRRFGNAEIVIALLLFRVRLVWTYAPIRNKTEIDKLWNLATKTSRKK
jgi:uncharacterized protein (DUF3820 family)